MKQYTILPKSQTIDWNDVPIAPIDTRLWTKAVDITATAQVCYDEEALYLRLTAKEAHIRAEETGPVGMPCLDSCLEFFFSPMEGDERYINVEFNPEKCMYLGFCACRHSSVRLLANVETVLQPCVSRTADGWEITYQIPFTFIRLFFRDFVAAPGKKMRANFYKCGDLTVCPHYFSWNPVDHPTPDFHRPEYFGELIFG